MLDTQNELEEALSRPITNDTTDMTELETELEELLSQPIPPTPVVNLPIPQEVISTPVTNEVIKPPEQDPFADLELRLQKLGVKECKCFFKNNNSPLQCLPFLLATSNKVPEIASSSH
jgi:hypothetical protein